MTPAITNNRTSSDRTAHASGRDTATTAVMFPATTGAPGLPSTCRLLLAAGAHKNSGRKPGPPPACETAGP